MSSNFSFGNLDQVKPAEGFEPIPVGIYPLRCLAMEMKDAASGRGSFLKCEFQITTGAFEGRRIFHRFNLVNESSQAVEIALREVKAWIEACGMPAEGELTMEKLQALEGKGFPAKVGIERDKTGQYEPDNKITRFITGAAGTSPIDLGPPTSVPTAPPAPAPKAAGAKPWE